MFDDKRIFLKLHGTEIEYNSHAVHTKNVLQPCMGACLDSVGNDVECFGINAIKILSFMKRLLLI